MRRPQSSVDQPLTARESVSSAERALRQSSLSSAMAAIGRPSSFSTSSSSPSSPSSRSPIFHAQAARGRRKQRPPLLASTSTSQRRQQSALRFSNAFRAPSLGAALDCVDPASISAADFHSRYVATRTPCLLSSFPSPSEWRTSLWSNSYLKARAGDCRVQVERREPGAAGFGQAGKTTIAFGAFIDALDSGDASMYLTTQYADDEERPLDHAERRRSPVEDGAVLIGSAAPADLRYLLAPPLSHLLSDFPLLPSLFSHLVPAQYNLWFGHSSKPTSSRLHHDFHDNLYVLLRGSKTFTLVSPSSAAQLRTAGRIVEVKRNGLICYDADVHEDGSTDAERLDEARHAVEERIAALEVRLEAIEREYGNTSAAAETAREQLEALEEELEAVLGETLEMEGADGVSSEEGSEDESEGSDELSLSSPAERHLQQRRIPAQRKRKRSQTRDREPTSTSRVRPHIAADADPPSFSALSTATLPDSVPRWIVRLQAPALLYLPASWFHEVFSESSAGEGKDKGHLALNFWFMPPDRLSEEDEESEDNAAERSPFARSYSQHALWGHRWKRQAEQLQRLREQQQEVEPLPTTLRRDEKARAGSDGRQETMQQRNGHDNSVTPPVQRGHTDEAFAKPRRPSTGVIGQRGWRSKR